LSKLILCLVMIRGRHRGLPVAIDRAIIIPSEFRQRYAETESTAGGAAPARTLTGELRENQGIGTGTVYSQGSTGGLTRVRTFPRHDGSPKGLGFEFNHPTTRARNESSSPDTRQSRVRDRTSMDEEELEDGVTSTSLGLGRTKTRSPRRPSLNLI
jgi:hypothetical protein